MIAKAPPIAIRNWYNAAELAPMWGVSRQAIYDAAKSGRLPCVIETRGTQVMRRFPKDEIDALDKSRLPSTRQPRAAIRSPDRSERLRLEQELRDEQLGRALAEQRINDLMGQLDLAHRRIRHLLAALAEDASELSIPPDFADPIG